MKKVVRRLPLKSKVSVEEDIEEREDDTSDDDDEDNGKSKDSKFSLSNYVLIVLVVIFGLSYLHERDMRFQLIDEYNKNIDKASEELLTAQSKSSSKCPECPICNGEDTVKAEEEPLTMTVEGEVVAQQWATRDKALTTEIQRLSKQLLQIKFGAPPYYVELDIQASQEGVQGGKILIEMAPVDQMPYSVHYFLTQVRAGAWNYCGFFLNLGVVYLEDARGGKEECNKEAFASIEGIGENLAFQEYSPLYPHLTNTIGLSGRPGGLGFYVSVSNNTKPLGPKGTVIEGGPPIEADPCIGHLVRGEDTLIRMKRIERENDAGDKERLFQDINAFEQIVSLKSVSILSAAEVGPL